MKKYFIILGLLIGISPAFAQRNFGKGAKNFVRVESKLAQERVEGIANIGRIVKKAITSSQIQASEAKGEFLPQQGISQMAKASQLPVQPLAKKAAEIQTPDPVLPIHHQQERYVSPYAMFLRDETEVDFSAWVRSETPHDWENTVTSRRTSAKRSLEEVEAECIAKGMLPRLIDLIPPTQRLAQLTDWLATYNAMKEGGKESLRYVDVIREGNLTALGVEGEEIQAIRSEDEFQAVLPNYIQDTYQEPFNPEVTYMRILAVNDIAEYIEPLQKAARQNRHVTVDVVPTIELAQETLEKAFKRHDPYNIVLLDYHGLQGRASDLAKWIHESTHLSVPVVFYSSARSMPEILFKFHIVGRIDVAATVEEAHQVLNYSSNIVVTGKAYPNN